VVKQEVFNTIVNVAAPTIKVLLEVLQSRIRTMRTFVVSQITGVPGNNKKMRSNDGVKSDLSFERVCGRSKNSTGKHSNAMGLWYAPR
jgi:hypothetical protein